MAKEETEESSTLMAEIHHTVLNQPGITMKLLAIEHNMSIRDMGNVVRRMENAGTLYRMKTHHKGARIGYSVTDRYYRGKGGYEFYVQRAIRLATHLEGLESRVIRALWAPCAAEIARLGNLESTPRRLPLDQSAPLIAHMKAVSLELYDLASCIDSIDLTGPIDTLTIEHIGPLKAIRERY